VVLQSPIQTPVLNGLGDMGGLDLLGAFQVGDGAADFKELKRLGDHIRKRKLELGLFQREVAQRIRVTQGTVYRWEGMRVKRNAEADFRGRTVFSEKESLNDQI